MMKKKSRLELIEVLEIESEAKKLNPNFDIP
jgi:hypothetical protein